MKSITVQFRGEEFTVKYTTVRDGGRSVATPHDVLTEAGHVGDDVADLVRERFCEENTPWCAKCFSDKCPGCDGTRVSEDDKLENAFATRHEWL